MRWSRVWMTGCMALVLLVAGRAGARETRDAEDGDGARGQRSRITLTTRHDLDETVRQVARLARRAGLPVVAQAVPEPVSVHGEAAAMAARVLVLGDEAGRTPVIQADADSGLTLPWQVVVRQRPDGLTEVSLPWADAAELPNELTEDTLRKVSALPQALSAALAS